MFPICRGCTRRTEEGDLGIARAVRVLGARGHYAGVEIVPAFQNESFARAFVSEDGAVIKGRAG